MLDYWGLKLLNSFDSKKIKRPDLIGIGWLADGSDSISWSFVLGGKRRRTKTILSNPSHALRTLTQHDTINMFQDNLILDLDHGNHFTRDSQTMDRPRLAKFLPNRQECKSWCGFISSNKGFLTHPPIVVGRCWTFWLPYWRGVLEETRSSKDEYSTASNNHLRTTDLFRS